MAVAFLPGSRRTIRKGTIDDQASFTEELQLVTDGESTILDCMKSNLVPKKGMYHIRDPRFRCKSVDLEEVLAPPGGGYLVNVTINWESLTHDVNAKDQEGNPITYETPPWLLPIENFTSGAVPLEETIKNAYVEDGFLDYKSVPFCNTAGVPLNGTRNRYLFTFGFSYNVPYMSPAGVFEYTGKINASGITVAGMYFSPLQLQILSIGSEPRTEYDEDGFVRWSYDKVSVQFQADPETFYRKFANVGTLALWKNDTENPPKLGRIWSGVVANEFAWKGKQRSKDEIVYNSRKRIIEWAQENKIVRDSIEAVTEPLFLDRSGTDISPFDDVGRQTPTYVGGCVDQPVSFASLNLPATRW